jgi:putative transposase
VASNNKYEIHDHLHVLLTAAQHNDYLEGTCRSVSGASDAETLFNRLAGVSPRRLVEAFKQDVLANLAGINRACRNRRMVLAADVTAEPYYGSHPDTWVHKQKFHKGATGSYPFLVLSVLTSLRREVVGVLPLRRGDGKNRLLLTLLDGLKHRLHVEALLLDRGFDSGWLIQELKWRRIRFLLLWRQAEWTRRVFEDMGRRKWLRKRRTLLVGDCEVSFMLVFVKGVKIGGDERTYRWVFATNMREKQPIKYILHYRMRWGVETLFRVLDSLQVKTKTTDMGKRFFLVLISVYLYNTWKEFLSNVEFHVSLEEYASHVQAILEEIHPCKPPTKRQTKVRDQIKAVFGFNVGSFIRVDGV